MIAGLERFCCYYYTYESHRMCVTVVRSLNNMPKNGRTRDRVEREINTKWQINPGARRYPFFWFPPDSVLLTRSRFVKDKRTDRFPAVLGKWSALNDPFLWVFSLLSHFFFFSIFLFRARFFYSIKQISFQKKETYVGFISGQLQEGTGVYEQWRFSFNNDFRICTVCRTQFLPKIIRFSSK